MERMLLAQEQRDADTEEAENPAQNPEGAAAVAARRCCQKA
jgi:hypothetical protein